MIQEPGAPERTIHRTVTTGGSFGANPLRQHIGVAKAAKVARLEVHWPATGKTQVFTDLTVNRLYEIKETEGKLRSNELVEKPFKKGAPAKKHLHVTSK